MLKRASVKNNPPVSICAGDCRGLRPSAPDLALLPGTARARVCSLVGASDKLALCLADRFMALLTLPCSSQGGGVNIVRSVARLRQSA